MDLNEGQGSKCIPPEAASFIAHVLYLFWERTENIAHIARYGSLTTFSSNLGGPSGMRILYKHMLRRVWNDMRRIPYFAAKIKRGGESIKSFSNLNKNGMIRQIAAQFFQTDGVNVDQSAMQSLSSYTQGLEPQYQRLLLNRQQKEASTESQASHSEPRSSQRSQSLRSPHPLIPVVPHVVNQVSFPPIIPYAPPVYHYPPFHPRHIPNGPNPHPAGLAQTAPRNSFVSNPPTNSSTNQPSLKTPDVKTMDRKTVKQEDDADLEDESVPRDDQESHLLRTLTQMGFTDQQEILDSIRRVKFKRNSNCVTPTIFHQSISADNVMLSIISQREESELARQTDLARTESERSRKEEASRRRLLAAQEKEQKLRSASLSNWKKDKEFFARSWVLADETVFDSLLEQADYEENKHHPVKEALLLLLKLERDSRKWYKDVPCTYFTSVVNSSILASSRPKELVEYLNHEIDKIKHALCSLEGTVGICFIWVEIRCM